MWYYYYNSTTGEFTMRTKKPYTFTTDPYIEREKAFNYGDYRVDLSTQEPVKKN